MTTTLVDPLYPAGVPKVGVKVNSEATCEGKCKNAESIAGITLDEGKESDLKSSLGAEINSNCSGAVAVDSIVE